MSKRVLLIIPCRDEWIHQDVIRCINSMYVPNDFTLNVEFISTYSVSQSRNKGANLAKDLSYDYLMYSDSDQLLPVDTLQKLLDCNADMAAGWSMMATNDSRTNISVYDKENMSYSFVMVDDVPNGIIEVDAIGFAAVLIKIEILDKLIYPYFQYIEYENKTMLSEDLHFCLRLRQDHDIKILCDTSLKIPHMKTIVI